MQLELRKLGIIDNRIFNAISSLSKENFLPEELIGFVNEYQLFSKFHSPIIA